MPTALNLLIIVLTSLLFITKGIAQDYVYEYDYHYAYKNRVERRINNLKNANLYFLRIPSNEIIVDNAIKELSYSYKGVDKSSRSSTFFDEKGNWQYRATTVFYEQDTLYSVVAVSRDVGHHQITRVYRHHTAQKDSFDCWTANIDAFRNDKNLSDSITYTPTQRVKTYFSSSNGSESIEEYQYDQKDSLVAITRNGDIYAEKDSFVYNPAGQIVEHIRYENNHYESTRYFDYSTNQVSVKFNNPRTSYVEDIWYTSDQEIKLKSGVDLLDRTYKTQRYYLPNKQTYKIVYAESKNLVDWSETTEEYIYNRTRAHLKKHKTTIVKNSMHKKYSRIWRFHKDGYPLYFRYRSTESKKPELVKFEYKYRL